MVTNTPPSENNETQSNEPTPLIEPSDHGDASNQFERTEQVEPTPLVESTGQVEPAAPEEQASVGEPVPLVEPAETSAERSELTAPTIAHEEESRTTVVAEERIAESDRTVAEEPAPVATPAAAPVQTVYVTAPTPPRKKGNRGFGAMFALIALVVFAALFAGIIALVMFFILPGGILAGSFTAFLASSAFWVPLIAFLVFFLLMVLIVNRAGWSVWVLGSFIVAVLVYFGSIGGILLSSNIFQMTQAEALDGFRQLSLSAPVIVATVLAREVTIWFGAAIASRGRKVKVRNEESQATFERELAESRA